MSSDTLGETGKTLANEVIQRPTQGPYPFFRNDEALAISLKSRIANIKEEGVPRAMTAPPLLRYLSPRIRLASHNGLPAFLTDSLDAPPEKLDSEDEIQAIASSWLFRAPVTSTLFGIENPEEVRQQLRFVSSNRFVLPQATSADRNAGLPIRFPHAYYQQYWQTWPVLGGTVGVHLARADTRVTATNSFFALTKEQKFTPPVDIQKSKQDAVDQARRALATHPHLQYAVKALNIAEWQWDKEIFIVPYRRSELLILPFDGAYYLAYQIELISSDQSRAWRVFVDSEHGLVLGEPHELVAHIKPSYYKTSDDVLVPQTNLYGDDLQLLSDNLDRFAKWGRYNLPNTGKLQQVLLTLNSSSPLFQEFTNIGVHAYELYKHFIDPAAGAIDETKLQGYKDAHEERQQPGLTIIAGKGGATLDMGFTFASALPRKPIHFQSSPAAGLDLDFEGPGINAKKVFSPSLDPEVIYHELTHAFLWLINPSPFETQPGSTPFALALAEGYANYFARSFAEGSGASTDSHWARAAYRPTHQQSGLELGWGDDWALARPASKAREDFLPFPDIYPDVNQAPTRQEIAVYYIGMVWARALWEVRQLLGYPLADRIALRAYSHLVGWVSTYEIAALSFLDSGKTEPAAQPHLDAIAAIFNRRRILAQKDAQALIAVGAPHSQVVLLGADQGLSFSTTPATGWSPTNPPVAGGLSGIIALASDGGANVYAATKAEIYIIDAQNLATGVGWTPAGNWSTLPGYIRCLHRTKDGLLLAGTNDGVYLLNNAGVWEKLGSHTFKALTLTSHGVGAQQKLFVAGIGVTWAVYTAVPAGASTSWQTWQSSADSQDLPLALQVIDDTVYTGTSGNGVWWRKFDASTQPAYFSGALAGAMILCLHVDPTTNVLYAGTTNGLYEATRTNEQITHWRKINLGQSALEPMMVTAISTTQANIIAGTAAAGLFVGAKGSAPLAAVAGVFG